MTASLQDLDLSVLTIAERIQIAQNLLDSVLAETQGEFFTPEQLQEIDRRVAAADAGKIAGEPFESVFAELLRR